MIIAEPPVIYSHPFPGKVIELRLSADDVHDVCRWPTQKPSQQSQTRITGCAFLHRDDLCIIVMPIDMPEPRLSALRRHEIAHCNGWPADHRRAA